MTANETVQLFANDPSLAQEGRYLRAWLLWDYSFPQSMPDGAFFLSQQALKFFDCALRQSSTRLVVLYSGQKATGDVLAVTVTFAPERVTEHMHAVVPGSLGELQLDYVCKNAPKPMAAPPK